jgi:CRISPR-associated protein Csb2
MMFAIGIYYLNGWAMATHPTDRERPEWPPHPDRVFMALASAHFETEGSATEHEALEWLEQQPPPALAVSSFHARSCPTSYVPVNDVAIPRFGKMKASPAQVKAGLSVLPEFRLRQPRQFPVAIPENPVMYLIWPEAHLPTTHRQALEYLCRKVTYVGHSASLVQMWIEDHPPAATLEPITVEQGRGRYRLRVTPAGRLAYLGKQFKAGLRPTPSLWRGYDEPRQEPPPPSEPHTVFDTDIVILRRLDGPSFGLETTLQLTEALRGAVMAACPPPIPEWISGHTTDGSRSELPHLACFPLAHIGREHADGHLLGLAMALPRGATTIERRQCLRDLLYEAYGEPRAIELTLGRIGTWRLALEDRESRPVALVQETWTSAPPYPPAKRWATVTPIVLDRHPKSKDSEQYWVEAETTVRQSCRRIGLPEPADVVLSPVSMFVGVPHVRGFPLMQRKTGGNLHHTHAIITFPESVRGPVFLGAGRYRGYGVCRPFRHGGDDPS